MKSVLTFSRLPLRFYSITIQTLLVFVFTMIVGIPNVVSGDRSGLPPNSCRERTSYNREKPQEDSVILSILTWNIQMLPNGFAIFSSALRKKQHIRVYWIIDYLKEKSYDVVVFQEAFDVDMRRKIRRRLRKVYPYQVNTKTRAGRLTNNGVLILSRIPMKYVDHVIYERGVGSDRLSAKGCTMVELEKNGLVFQIAGTHLQAGSNDEATSERTDQFKSIRRIIDQNNRDYVPVIITGDMNTRKSDHKEYNAMIELLDVIDVPVQDPHPYTIDGINSWNDHKNGLQLDYVMIRPHLTTSKVIDQRILRLRKEYDGRIMDYSDHYGIEAEILITNE